MKNCSMASIRYLLVFPALLFSHSVFASVCGDYRFPSVDPMYPAPDDVEGFEMSQDYPMSLEDDNYPWKDIHPVKDPEKYMEAVLEYSLEGNIEKNFRGQDNDVRKWYHAPWLHDDGNNRLGWLPRSGREYMNGMTRERPVPARELHEKQTKKLESWAVGMYNAAGAHAIGKAWCSEATGPNPALANFPENSVAFKLLFTAGTKADVPFLENTLSLKANIYTCTKKTEKCRTRENKHVQLLQLDIAVKDNRAQPSGWVLGTFVYDASQNNSEWQDNLVPVGASWGADSGIAEDLNKTGAFVNTALKETWLNKTLFDGSHEGNPKKAYVTTHGVGGRLNGPIDNPISSCHSCHGFAAIHIETEDKKVEHHPFASFRSKRETFSLNTFEEYFPTVAPGTGPTTLKDVKYTRTDFSLQVSAGMRNYYAHIFKGGNPMNTHNANNAFEAVAPKMEDISSYIEAPIDEKTSPYTSVNRGGL